MQNLPKSRIPGICDSLELSCAWVISTFHLPRRIHPSEKKRHGGVVSEGILQGAGLPLEKFLNVFQSESKTCLLGQDLPQNPQLPVLLLVFCQ